MCLNDYDNDIYEIDNGDDDKDDGDDDDGDDTKIIIDEETDADD